MDNEVGTEQKNPDISPGDAVFHPSARLPIHEERDTHHPTGRYSGFRFTREGLSGNLGKHFKDGFRSRRRVRNGLTPFSPEPGRATIDHYGVI